MMVDRNTRLLAWLALAVVLGACTQTGPGAGPRPKREAAEPKLALSAFIDSAGLHQALLAAPPAPADFALKPLFSVRYDSTGVLEEVEPISRRYFPAEYGRQMVEILRTHVRPRITATKETWYTVWLQSGSSPKIALLPELTEVRPVLANGPAIVRALDFASQRLQEARPELAGRRLTARVTMRVTDEGLTEALRLNMGTGDPHTDREILTIARSLRFTPASLEGHPVTVLATLPITISIPRPEPSGARSRP